MSRGCTSVINGAGTRDRTEDASLEGSSFTTKLCPRQKELTMQTALSKRSNFHLFGTGFQQTPMQKKSDKESPASKVDMKLTRTKPYKDWKDERLQLCEKWGKQGRRIRSPQKAASKDGS